MKKKEVDCKSKEGVIIGLIDGIMAMATALIPLINKNRTFFIEGSPVYEALKDLHQDDDVIGLLKMGPFNPLVWSKEDERMLTALRNGHKFLVEKKIINE